MNKASENKSSLKFFGIGKMLPFLKKYRGMMAMMVLFGICGSAIDIGTPLLQRYALNHFVGLGTLDTIVPFILIYVGVILFTGVTNYFSALYSLWMEVRLDRDLRNAAFEHLQTLSFSYFNQNSVGYIHARIMSDTSRIGMLFSWTIIDSVWQGAYVVGAIIAMLIVNAKLALLVLAILPLLVVLFSIFQKKLVHINREIREINSKITGNFNEGITGAKTVKTLVIEDRIEHDFKSETDNMLRRSVRAARLRGVFAATMNFFSMFMSYAQGMMEPIRWLVDAVFDFVTTQVNIERLTKLLETKPDVNDSAEVVAIYGDSFEPKKENWESLKGDVEFRDVSFKYPDGDEYILEHFDLKIPFGTNVAIVGETGAGKSTLANLVCRFYEPTAGSVLIDGRDARERSQLWLHSAIGYVLQTPHLFSGTVRENLLYAKPDATDEEIERALKLVSADEVVARLEKGLETDVGEGGDMLSTGEKQLISFSRAILAAPRILVLDVIEQGRHDELLAAHGHYYRLYTRQYEDEATSAFLSKKT